MNSFIDYQVFDQLHCQHMHHFTVKGIHFLAAAVYAEGHDTNTNSVIFKWNTKYQKFYKYQMLSTSGAKRFVHFEAFRNNFLFVANAVHFSGTKSKYFQTVLD